MIYCLFVVQEASQCRMRVFGLNDKKWSHIHSLAGPSQLLPQSGNKRMSQWTQYLDTCSMQAKGYKYIIFSK